MTKRSEGDKFLFFDSSYDFGKQATLSNWTKPTCSLYIVTYRNSEPWYGYDEKPDLSSFFEGKPAGSGDMQVFLNDNPSLGFYTCHYEKFNIIFDLEGKAVSVEDFLSTSVIKYNYFLDSSLTKQNSVELGVCENVWTCVKSYGTPTPTTSGFQDINIYSGSIDLESKKSECSSILMNLFKYEPKEDFSEESGDNSVCRTYGTIWSLLETAYYACNIIILDVLFITIPKQKLSLGVVV